MSFRGYIGRLKNNITEKRFRISGTEPYEGTFSLPCPYVVNALVANTRSNPGYPLGFETIETNLQNLMQLPELKISKKLEVIIDKNMERGDYISKN